MKVLVAEDDATSLRVLNALLEKWGFEPVSARDGHAALAVLDEPDPPKLVILDWMMPGVEGVEVCRRLRQRETQDPPYVLILTCRGQTEDIVEGLNSGANDYLSKPFDKDELHARLNVGRRVLELQGALGARVRELEAAVEHIRTLQGIIPICSYCNSIRTDQESWQKLEVYVAKHSQASFSHGICPNCLKKHHPDYQAEALR